MEAEVLLLQAIEYLEQTLKDSPTALIVVSHDRWFMENLCTQLLELHSGTAYMHSFGGGGSYAAFVEVILAHSRQCPAGVARRELVGATWVCQHLCLPVCSAYIMPTLLAHQHRDCV